MLDTPFDWSLDTPRASFDTLSTCLDAASACLDVPFDWALDTARASLDTPSAMLVGVSGGMARPLFSRAFFVGAPGGVAAPVLWRAGPGVLGHDNAAVPDGLPLSR